MALIQFDIIGELRHLCRFITQSHYLLTSLLPESS